MKKTALIIALSLSFALQAQKGKTFPSISGTCLNEKALSLPFKNGKETIVAIAFHRKAEEELKKWLNPLYYTFIKKSDSKNKMDMSAIYDVNFVFIPMISGFKKFADDFKKSTEKEFWPYILDTEKTDIKALQKELGVTDNKAPYFFVLDKNGKVTSVQSGEYTEEKVEALEEAAGGD